MVASINLSLFWQVLTSSPGPFVILRLHMTKGPGDEVGQWWRQKSSGRGPRGCSLRQESKIGKMCTLLRNFANSNKNPKFATTEGG